MTNLTTRAHRPATKQETHVLVLGAGMAGLATAAAAAPIVDRVTVVDHDQMPREPEPRRGTPQARHIHTLLPAGLQAWETLLPGVDRALGEAGSPELSFGGGFGFQIAGGWMRDVPQLRSRCVTRPVVEDCVRRLVRDRDDVELVEGWRATGLTVDRSGRVTGATGRHGGTEQHLAADLVVDATGQGSRAPQWLEALGFDAPDDEVVDPDLWYATTTGHGDPDLPGDMEAFVIVPDADDPIGGALITAEDGNYLVSTIGPSFIDPPSNARELRDHAARLPTTVLSEALAPLHLEDELVYSRSTATRLRRYHRVDLPEGFALIGDSICKLDPIYAQGMTVAALQACALRSLLQRLGPHDPRLTRRFQEHAWRKVKPAREQVVAADLELPTVDERAPVSVRTLNAYVQQALGLATRDPHVTEHVGRVLALLDEPTHLFHPAVLLRVVRDLATPGRPNHDASTPPAIRA